MKLSDRAQKQMTDCLSLESRKLFKALLEERAFVLRLLEKLARQIKPALRDLLSPQRPQVSRSPVTGQDYLQGLGNELRKSRSQQPLLQDAVVRGYQQVYSKKMEVVLRPRFESETDDTKADIRSNHSSEGNVHSFVQASQKPNPQRQLFAVSRSPVPEVRRKSPKVKHITTIDEPERSEKKVEKIREKSKTTYRETELDETQDTKAVKQILLSE